MQLCQIVNRAPQNLSIVDLWTEHNLRVNLNAGIDHALHLRADVGALFIDAEQIRAHIEIGRMHRNILRRKPLLDHAAHFIFTDRGQRRVVPIEKRQPHVFIAHEQGRPRRFRIAFAETKQAFIRALPRHDLFEAEAEVLCFIAFDV